MCGGVISVADPDLVSRSIASQLQDTQAKIVLCFSTNLARVQEARRDQDVKVVLLDMDHDTVEEDTSTGLYSMQSLIDKTKDLDPPEEDPETHDSDPVAILWLSDASGKPKGIRLNQNAFVVRTPVSERIMVSTCFYHIGGLLLPLEHITNGDQISFYPPHELESNPEPKVCKIRTLLTLKRLPSV